MAPTTALAGKAGKPWALLPAADALSRSGEPVRENSGPVGVGNPECFNISNNGGEDSGVSSGPLPVLLGSKAIGAMPPPVLGGREAQRLE